MLFDVRYEPVLVFAHFKKIIRFLNGFRCGLVIRTFAVDQFPFSIKALTSEAVLPFVFTEINVARIVDFLKNSTDDLHMGSIGCTDEVIVVDIEFRPECSKQIADLIDIGPGAQIFLFSRSYDLVSMFVGSREEINFCRAHGMKAGNDIGDNGGVGMP